MLAEQGRALALVGERRVRLREPDVRGEMVEADGGVNVALLVEDGAA